MSTAESKLREGIQLLAKHKFSKAEKMFQEVVDQSKAYAIGWLYLGTSYVLQKKLEEARLAHKTALQLNPDLANIPKQGVSNNPLTREMVLLQRAQMDLTDNIIDFVKPKEKADIEMATKLTRGIYGDYMEQVKNQYKLKKNKLFYTPEDDELRFQVASLLMLMGKFKDATKEFGKVLEKRPLDWKTHNTFLQCFGAGRLLKW